jgi:hypothetical protein
VVQRYAAATVEASADDLPSAQGAPLARRVIGEGARRGHDGHPKSTLTTR